MKRGLAVLLTCALIAFGQHSKTPPPPAHVTRYVDFLAFDAAGKPVTDLRPEDLRLTQAGAPRTVTGLAWFDARRHTARATATGAFELTPDEIRRNFVAIVDDPGMSAESIRKVQDLLNTFLRDGMVSGDRMAVLRASGGDGAGQQLTADRRVLNDAIRGIQFLGAGAVARAEGGANWLALHHALEGLRYMPGRKFVVLFSENLAATGVHDSVSSTVFGCADEAMAAVYAIDPSGPAPSPGGPAPPLQELADLTGGRYGADLSQVLDAESSFYVIGFDEPVEQHSILRAADDTPLLTVRRPGVTLRPRVHTLALQKGLEFPAPEDRLVQIRRGLLSPFAGADMRTSLTAQFNAFASNGAVVDAGIVVDTRDLSIIRDARGVSHASLRITAVASSNTGRTVPAIERSYNLTLPPGDRDIATRGGLLFTLSLRLPSAGVWRVRTLVADGVSDRLGSEAQSIWIPERNEFAMSSLVVRKFEPDRDKENREEKDRAGTQYVEAARIFDTGGTIQFLCGIFHPVVNQDKQARLEVRTRLYASGHVMFVGSPMLVTYAVDPAVASRQIAGRLALSADIVPGDYILQLTVTDLQAPGAAPRTVSRYTDLHLRGKQESPGR
jgi:VWFA-related protein